MIQHTQTERRFRLFYI